MTPAATQKCLAQLSQQVGKVVFGAESFMTITFIFVFFSILMKESKSLVSSAEISIYGGSA